MKVKNIPAKKFKVVDTTGAGDTFLGAFLVKYNFDNLFESLQFANIVAGIKITKMGAQVGMPTLSEVLDYYKNNNIKQFQILNKSKFLINKKKFLINKRNF